MAGRVAEALPVRRAVAGQPLPDLGANQGGGGFAGGGGRGGGGGGPRGGGAAAAAGRGSGPNDGQPYNYDRTTIATNANTIPGTASSMLPATPPTYQLTIIGGFSDAFHFYPIIVHDNTATIYPHNNLLQYGKSYYITIDPGVLTAPGFEGVSGKTAWTFSTKASGPGADASRLVVAADGSGDFNTIQGAMDVIPDHKQAETTVFVKNGTYEEIVYFRNKTNVHILGEDRKKVVHIYNNYEGFNVQPPGYTSNEKPGTFPYRRTAFMIDNCQDVQISNMTLRNPSTAGQAEALLIMGKQIIVSHCDLWGNTDTIQWNGSVYATDTFIDGGGDFLWGRGPSFFNNCDIQEHGANNPGGWVRSTSASHGFCLNGCRFTCPNATGIGPVITRNANGYPDSEFVMINCAVSTKYNPAAFTIPGATDAMHYWEYNTTNLEDGKPADVSQRAQGVKQLTKEKDAETIANYSNPAWVLNGWTPKPIPVP